MPSAASAKLEKQASSNQAESSETSSNITPIRQALVIIEHKIRNLEKRKTKLESYRAIQASGKELSSDQKSAVAKYDEVAQSLEFARELSKQMAQLATISEKEQKKQARREALLRAQAETAKIREVLTIQNILSQFTDATVREDFVNGSNGAAKLDENDLKILEKFYIDIQVKRQSTPEDTPFVVCAQKAAEYLSLTIDGRPKQYGETTFENIRRILQSIQECGYLDRAGKIEETAYTPEEELEESGEQVVKDNEEKPLTDIINQQQNEVQSENVATINIQVQQQSQPQPHQIPHQVQGNVSQTIDVPKFPTEAPSAAAVPAPAFPQQPQPPQSALVNSQIPGQPQQLQRPVVPSPITANVAQGPVAQVPAGAVAPASGNAIHTAHFPPTTVRAVEQAYFKQHQYIQQIRPLAEVIGSGNFYFLQDSELDSPDLVPSGFTSNEAQNASSNISTGNLPQQSPNTSVPLPNQTTMIPQQLPQQQQQPPPSQQMQPSQQSQSQQTQVPIPQPGIHQKAQQPANTTPIPTQTFTNQSFPHIVPPAAIFPQNVQNPDIPCTSPQIQVFTGPHIAIPQMVTTQRTPVVSQGSGTNLANVTNPQQHVQQPQVQPQVTVLTQQSSGGPGSIVEPATGANVPLAGYPSTTKYPVANPTIGIHQVNNQIPQVVDKYEKVQSTPVNMNEPQNLKIVEEVKDRTQDTDWETKESVQKSIVTANNETESNQWSTEVANSAKNEWNSNFDNQNESNTWNNSQNDNYGNRGNRNNFGGNNRGSTGGGGGRGLRGGSGPPSNGYRGRSNNNYQQQQNGRNPGVYFRSNNDSSGYYQNQNGGYSGNKQDTGNSYGGSSNNNNYRPRGNTGGPMSQSNRQQPGSNRPPNTGSGAPPRNTTNSNRPNAGMSNPGNRPGRNSGTTGTYGSSRPPNSVRQQQQDVNA